MPIAERQGDDMSEASKLRSLLLQLDEEEKQSNNLPSLLENLSLDDKGENTDRQILFESSSKGTNDKQNVGTLLTSKGIENQNNSSNFGRERNKSATHSTSNSGHRPIQNSQRPLPQLQVDDPAFIEVIGTPPTYGNLPIQTNGIQTSQGPVLCKSLTIHNRLQYQPSQNNCLIYTDEQQKEVKIPRLSTSLTSSNATNCRTIPPQHCHSAPVFNGVHINTKLRERPQEGIFFSPPETHLFGEFDDHYLSHNVVTDDCSIDQSTLNNIFPKAVTCIPSNRISEPPSYGTELSRETPSTLFVENDNSVTDIFTDVFPSIPPDHSLHNVSTSPTHVASLSSPRHVQSPKTTEQICSNTGENTTENGGFHARSGIKRPLSSVPVIEFPKEYEDDDGNKPLHLAIEIVEDENQSRESREKAKWVVDSMKCLTEQINLKNHFDQTPLFLAVKWNMRDVVEQLIECGADVNEQGLEERTRMYLTPLHIAAKNGTNGLDVMKVLLEVEDININAQSLNSRIVPLHMAIESKCYDGIKLLIDKGCCVLSEDDKSYTPLMLAVQTKNLEIIRLILLSVPVQERRDYVNIASKSGNTCLHLAAGLPNVDDQVKVRILRFLLNNHAIIDAQNKDNETATDIANAQMREVLSQLKVHGVNRIVVGKN